MCGGGLPTECARSAFGDAGGAGTGGSDGTGSRDGVTTTAGEGSSERAEAATFSTAGAGVASGDPRTELRR